MMKLDDLSGTWLCNDGGKYYLRYTEDETEKLLWWLGESRQGGDVPWTVVFKGNVNGNIVEGKWAALPRGTHHTDNNGSLKLKINESGGKLELVRMPQDEGQRGGYGGSAWEKLEKLE